ncbi:MAG: hypothetical protein IPP97_26440 [Candidatus Obscuribacter sp.]|nr:hypothetical protein [Candidatus Obscuribacter sp.]MBP6348441.1 hypothetical protein [Candidatus Obscuribacter sp.]MBP6592402.1 hypothetical protein [Candidatus Obscuribacter sp.]
MTHLTPKRIPDLNCAWTTLTTLFIAATLTSASLGMPSPAVANNPPPTSARAKHKKPTAINYKHYPGLAIKSMDRPADDVWSVEPHYSIAGGDTSALSLTPEDKTHYCLFIESDGNTTEPGHPYQTLLKEPPHTLSKEEIDKYKYAEYSSEQKDYFENVKDTAEEQNREEHGLVAYTKLLNEKMVLVKEYSKKDGMSVYKIQFNLNPDKSEHFMLCSIAFEAPPEQYRKQIEKVKDALQTIEWHNEVREIHHPRYRTKLLKWGLIRTTQDKRWPIKYMQLPRFTEWDDGPYLSVPGYLFYMSANKDHDTCFVFNNAGEPGPGPEFIKLFEQPNHVLTSEEMTALYITPTGKDFKAYTEDLNGRRVLVTERHGEDKSNISIEYLEVNDEPRVTIREIGFEAKPEIYDKYIDQVRASFKSIKWLAKKDPYDQ